MSAPSNSPGNPGGIGILAGGLKTGFASLKGMAEKRHKRKTEFAAGHKGAGMLHPEHLSMLIEGALALDAQQHRQAQERFEAANTASKPGKSIGVSAQGDVNISELPEKAKKQAAAPEAAPAPAPAPAASEAPKPKARIKPSRGARGGGAY